MSNSISSGVKKWQLIRISANQTESIRSASPSVGKASEAVCGNSLTFPLIVHEVVFRLTEPIQDALPYIQVSVENVDVSPTSVEGKLSRNSFPGKIVQSRTFE